MNIKFSCKHCGYKMNSDKKNAGKRAECPNCNCIIVIPKNSSDIPVIYEDSFFKSEKLDGLFDSFMDEYGDSVLHQKLKKEKNKIVLQLEIKTDFMRSQLIWLFYETLEDGEEWLSATSIIGEISNTDELAQIMGSANKLTLCPTYSLTVSDNCAARLVHSRRIENIDSKAFYDMTINLAQVADIIEQETFGIDRT